MVVLVANDAAPVLLLAHYVDQGVVRGHEDVAMMLIFFEVFTEALREQQ